jgi:uncharacterized Zn-finger protein
MGGEVDMGYNDHLNDIPDEQVTCPHCGKIYLQRTEEQVPGFRSVDEDICPYCGAENGRSMEVEFHNKKIGE